MYRYKPAELIDASSQRNKTKTQMSLNVTKDTSTTITNISTTSNTTTTSDPAALLETTATYTSMWRRKRRPNLETINITRIELN